MPQIDPDHEYAQLQNGSVTVYSKTFNTIVWKVWLTQKSDVVMGDGSTNQMTSTGRVQTPFQLEDGNRNLFHQSQDLQHELLQLSKGLLSGSDYQAGHVTSAGERKGNPIDYYETFDAKNFWIQSSESNQGVWEAYESFIRREARNSWQVWNIAGSYFDPEKDVYQRGEIAIPHALWKANAFIPSATHRVERSEKYYSILVPNKPGAVPLLAPFTAYGLRKESLEQLTGHRFYDRRFPLGVQENSDWMEGERSVASKAYSNKALIPQK